MPSEQDTPQARAQHVERSSLLRKVVVAITGVTVILIGIPLIPLFGPGWLIVLSGLAILASEFAWAGRLQERIRAKFRSLTRNRTDN